MTQQLSMPPEPASGGGSNHGKNGQTQTGSTQPVVLSRTELYDESWVTSFLRPVLVVILISCVNVVLLGALARMADPVAPAFFPVLTLLATVAAIVGAISTTVLAQPGNRIRRTAGLRTAEISLLLAATRLVVWFMGTGLPTLNEALTQPLTVLTDPLFLGCGFIVGLSWILAVDVTDNMTQLGLRGDELYRARHGLEMHADSMRGAATDRRMLLQQFLTRWIGVGLLLILLAAMLRRDVLANSGGWSGIIGMARQSVEPQIMVAIVLYFLVGLVLISQGRLAMLRARWALDRLAASDTVSRRWSPQLLLVLGVIAIGALFLPLGGTFLLATILAAIINAVITVLMIVYQLIMYAILWVLSFFSGEAPPEPPPLVQPTPLPPAEFPEALATTPLLPEWFGGSIFWLVVAALVLYAAVLYFRDKGVRFGWLTWLWQQLRLRWGELAGMVRPARGRARGRDGANAGAGGRDPFGWLRRRAPDDPDALVRYYYFSTLEEAKEAGIARRAHETPRQYAQRLEMELAQRQAAQTAAETAAETSTRAEGNASGVASAETAATDLRDSAEREAVGALTDAFVAQRYGGRRTDSTFANRLQEKWRTMQDALRRRTGR